MISFLKLIISNLRKTKENNENNQKDDVAKAQKITYILFLICALIFISIVIYVVIKNFPEFTSSLKNSYEDSKYIIEDLK